MMKWIGNDRTISHGSAARFFSCPDFSCPLLSCRSYLLISHISQLAAITTPTNRTQQYAP